MSMIIFEVYTHVNTNKINSTLINIYRKIFLYKRLRQIFKRVLFCWLQVVALSECFENQRVQEEVTTDLTVYV